MLKRLVQVSSLLLIVGLAVGCGLLDKPTLTPTAVPSATPVPPTPTLTPIPPSSTPTATPAPTHTPTLSPTPTPLPAEWTRYPNTLDLRAVLPLDDALWLASLSGLIRIDWTTGRWTAFNEPDGLIDNTLVSLAAQGDWLWIGTQGGVSRYDRVRDTWRSYTTEDGLSSNHNVVVHVDGETVWAGTRNGLSWYEPANDSWQSLYTAAGIEISGVDGLLADETLLWTSVSPHAGTVGGLLRLDKASGEWSAISRESSAPPFNSFTLTHSEAMLWAVPAYGIPWEYNRGTGSWRPLYEVTSEHTTPSARFAGALYYDRTLWLFDEAQEELVRYDPSTRLVSRHPAEQLKGLRLQGQIAGRERTLWFPGQFGLMQYDLETATWQRVIRPDGPGSVNRLWGERNSALLVETEQAIGFWSPGDGHWAPLGPALPSPDGVALERGSQSVWLAYLSWGGLGDSNEPAYLILSPEPGGEWRRFELTPPAGWELRQILLRPIANTLWFVGSHGFLSYNPAVDQWAVFELSTEPMDLYQVQLFDQTAWFLSGNRLGRFDTNTGVVTLIPLPAVAASQGSLAFTVTADAVWLLIDGALYRGGLYGEGWTPVSVDAPCFAEAGLLAFWSGRLWAGGPQGAGHLSPETGNWRCFTPADGMLDREVEQILVTEDALWFYHHWYGLWQYREP